MLRDNIDLIKFQTVTNIYTCFKSFPHYLLQNGSDVPLERVAIRFLASRIRTSKEPLAGMPGFLEYFRLVTSGGTYFTAK